ncbi:hypothetical protein EGI22_02720 [Lacihabitans sp. LS3-19]|uniref:hypothetical protein n=1 Tax=Lacihabitans sp. LS3-19 TaxID=2487335 RepID=UPI0020CF239C|nr:hypothetical protein [Lacihabitans sp. LS3-19]MCP9766805.1 hypothetical protein [Lacihabitans sp. LS3-19]
MKTIITFFFLALTFSVFAQEPHQKQALEIEELLEKNNPEQFRSIRRKSNYLVLNNYRSGKRRRYYEGQLLAFKTKEGQFFQEEINEIGDSTITVLFYNTIERKLETHIIPIKNISKVYRREVYKGIRWGLGVGSLAALLPLGYDWIYFNKLPWQNTQALIMIPAIQAGVILLNNRSKFFNGIKLNDNKQLKIFKSL